MTTWVQRLKERMDIVGISREMLAQKMGITYGAITHYLTGKRIPPLGQFQKLATILQVDPAWLQYGMELKSDKDKINEISHPLKHPVPILSWDLLKNNRILNEAKSTDFVPGLYSKNFIYGLRVVGDSMVSPNGFNVSFHEGDIIIVNPTTNVSHGNFIITLLKHAKEATFKQFVIDSGISYLKPLNPQYPLMKFDDCEAQICGVVIGCLSIFCQNIFNI